MISVLLPVESGEKIGFGVTLLLAQVFNMVVLSSLIPTSSQDFPELGKLIFYWCPDVVTSRVSPGYYFLITISLIAMSLIYNTINVNIYYYEYKEVFCSFCAGIVT